MHEINYSLFRYLILEKLVQFQHYYLWRQHLQNVLNHPLDNFDGFN